MATPIYMSLKTQDEWKKYLQHLVRTNDKALLRSVLVIYERQTLEERVSKSSLENNGVGFSKWDAEEMSDIAKKLKRGERLQHNEMVHARIVMPKYWRQLMVVSKQTVAKRLESEYNEVVLEERKRFEEANETMIACMDRGVTCSYGICDECIVNRGVQMHI